MRVLDRQTLGGLSQVRLVGKDFNEIINVADALEKAEDAGLDLVLVSDTVTPPVVRIKDQKKEEYEKCAEIVRFKDDVKNKRNSKHQNQPKNDT